MTYVFVLKSKIQWPLILTNHFTPLIFFTEKTGWIVTECEAKNANCDERCSIIQSRTWPRNHMAAEASQTTVCNLKTYPWHIMHCNFAVCYLISLIFWPKVVPSVFSNQAKFEQNWLKNEWYINILICFKNL